MRVMETGGVPMPRRLRQAVLSLHGWAGRAVAVYFLFLFGTGTLLVFGHELEALVSPQMWGSGAVPDWGALLDAVLAAHPEAEPRILEAPPSPWLAAPVTLREGGAELIGWFAPETAALQGTTPGLGLREVLRQLHIQLLVEHRFALMAVAALSLPLLWQVVSGLWSTRRFWRGWTRRPRLGQGGRTGWGGLHRWAGVWALPVLAVTGLTGALYFAETLGFAPDLPAADPPAPREAALPEGFDGADLDRAVDLARAALPGLSVRRIYLPAHPGAGIVIRGELTAALVRPRANAVTVDPVTMSVLGVHRGEDLSPGRRLTEAADPLHFGQWGGEASRLLWVMGGALALLLAFSGLRVAGWRLAGPGGAGSLRRAWGGIFLPARLAILAALAVAVAATVLRLG